MYAVEVKPKNTRNTEIIGSTSAFKTAQLIKMSLEVAIKAIGVKMAAYQRDGGEQLRREIESDLAAFDSAFGILWSDVADATVRVVEIEEVSR